MKKTYGIDIKWLAVTSFEFRCGNTTVVSDPYITECVGTDCTWENIDNCDIILLGHAHWDHVTDIPRLVEKYHPLILCGDQTALPLAQWLNYTATRIYPMYPNLELDFGDVKIKALYGRHGPLPGPADERMERHKNSPANAGDPNLIELGFWGDFEYRNFLYTTPGGTKIMICGSKLHRDQQNILRQEKPDVVLLQVVGVNGAARTAELMKEIGCKVLIPFHFDFPNSYMNRVEELADALKELAPEIQYIVPEYGRWIEL